MAIAVGGMVLAGIASGVYHVVWGSTRTSEQVETLADIDNASLRIKEDLQMAQTTSLTDGDPVPQNSVTLSWIDLTAWAAEENQNHTCTYAVSPGTTDLVRTYDGEAGIVGRYITYLGFTRDGRVINVVITAAVPGVTEQSQTLEFSVYLRTEE